MFQQLSEGLARITKQLTGIGRLTDSQIQDALIDIRRELLQADVALSVITEFSEMVREKAIGQDVVGHVRPGDAFIKIVQDELIELLGGEADTEWSPEVAPPKVVMLVGLQGAGKTTTVAKLAKWLKEQELRVLMVSTDVARPKAIEQLGILAESIAVDCQPVANKEQPVKIARAAKKRAIAEQYDVLLVDTAGRSHVDMPLMKEVAEVASACEPHECLLVADSMAGQDAANVAKSFNEHLPLTGIILSKADGDARGGAALSMKMVTQKPIKFIGTGEKIEALERFYPDRAAKRILGMGDIVSLVEQAHRHIDDKKAKKIAKKLKKRHFDFDDFFDQIQQMKKMGGVKSLMAMMPGAAKLAQAKAGMMDEGLLAKMEAIIQSMTRQERAYPALINGSRKRRISTGSGTTIQEVNRLLKQFMQAQKMVKRLKGKSPAAGVNQLRGQLPPEMGDLFNDER